MLRFGFLYSCFMVVAGSTLLAELPLENSAQEVPAVVEAQPTPAKFVLGNSAQPIEIEQAPSIDTLRAKQAQLSELQQEVRRLEKKLGVARQYQVSCVLGEVSMTKLREADPVLLWDQQTLSVADYLDECLIGKTLTPQQFRAIEASLQKAQAMKLLMSPTLITPAFEHASVHMGGGYPVQLAAGNQSELQFQEFGSRFKTCVEPLGENRVRVQVAPELVEKDPKNGTKIKGQVVPGTTTKSLDFVVDMQLNSTMIRSFPSREPLESESSLILAVTVSEVKPLATVSESPALQPIPEANETR